MWSRGRAADLWSGVCWFSSRPAHPCVEVFLGWTLIPHIAPKVGWRQCSAVDPHHCMNVYVNETI